MAKEYSGVKLDVTFTKASTRENIISAENIALSFGKLAKWYTDFAWSAWTAPTVEVTGTGNAITTASYGTGANANKLTLTKGTTFLTSSTQYISSITSAGSGNAVTALSVANGVLTYTKGSTFLTAHPTIPVETDTTSTASPDHGGTFTTVDSVTRDSNGHVKKINTKTVTLPAQYTHPTYTARTGKPTGNETPAFGATFTISQIKSDGTGHVTAATDRTVKIPDTTMGAATADTAGTIGLVPAPAAGKQSSFLRGDGTWVVPTNTDTKVTQTAIGSTYTNYRPLVISAANNATAGFSPSTVTDSTFITAGIYCQPSTGKIFAKEFDALNASNTVTATLHSGGLWLKSYIEGANATYNYNETVLKTYAGKLKSNNGMLVTLQGGGLTIVGGGESATSLANLIDNDQSTDTTETPTAKLDVGGTLDTKFVGDTEQLLLSSDNNIYFITACQTIANRKPVVLDTSSYFYPGTNETGSIGTIGNRWLSMYAKRYFGRLSQQINTTRQTTANLACEGTASMQLILATSSMTTGKPALDGYILDFDWDNTGPYKAQLSIPDAAAGSLQWRTQAGYANWDNAANLWRYVHDNTKGVGKTGFLAYPTAGSYYEQTTQNVTGALVITLPFAKTNGQCMIHFSVDIYNYITNQSVTYVIAGYCYNDEKWYQCTAYALGRAMSDFNNLVVRFGCVTGGKYKIQIGETTTVWKYPQVSIRDVTVGYKRAQDQTTYIANISDWTVTFESSNIANVTQTITYTRQFLPFDVATGSADANTYLDRTGWFNWNTTSGSNMPTTNYGILLSKENPSVQVFIPDNASGIYFRRRANTTATPTAWWGFTGTAGNTYNLDNFITSYTDEKVKITTLAASTAAATYMPTFVAAAGTSGVNVMSAIKYGHNPGTTSAVGNSRLILGNAAAEGSANNEQGLLRIYSAGTAYHTLYGMKTNTNIEHALPTVGGTLINSGCVGTGLTWDSTNNALKHSNSVTAVSTAALLKVKYDAQGHITGSSAATSSDLPAHTHYEQDVKFDTSYNYRSIDGTVFPLVPQSLINTMRTNRFAFLPASSITVQHSTDSGSNYTDSGYSDEAKCSTFISRHSGQIKVGPNTSAERTTSMRTMVTITRDSRYTRINRFYIWFSTSGHTVYVDIQYATNAADTTWVDWRTNVLLAGWAGPNLINGPTIVFGANNAHAKKIRFIFRYTSIRSDYKTQPSQVYEIAAYSDHATWTPTNNLMMNDHLYYWNYQQQAFFPAEIKVPTQLRIHNGNYGALFRNDGACTYILLTDSGSALNGNWNSLRPLHINNATGLAIMNEGLKINTKDGAFLELHGGTVTTKEYGCAAPKIRFTNSDSSQNAELIWDDKDGYCNPAALSLIGNQAGTYFIAPRIRLDSSSTTQALLDFKDANDKGAYLRYSTSTRGYGNIIAMLPYNADGIGVVFNHTGGGYCCIGAGESPSYFTAAVMSTDKNPYGTDAWTYGEEQMCITSDKAIYFASGISANFTTSKHTDWTDVKTALFDTDGYFRPSVDNKGQIGASNYKWNAMYATTFIGNLTGDVTGQISVTTTNPTGTSSTTYYGIFAVGQTGANYMRANDGFRVMSLQGTASAYGYDYLLLGNATASGNAGNKYGGIRLYGSDTTYIQLTNGYTDAPTSLRFTHSGGTTGANFSPATTAKYDLGTSSLKWRNVYATTFYGDLNGTINTATTATTQTKGNNSTKVATTAFVQTAIGDYIPLAGSDAITGNLKLSVKTAGYWLRDSSTDSDADGFRYPGIYDNGSNLWIGATQSAARAHTGGTMISAGHDKTSGKGNFTIRVYCPKADNTTHQASYLVYHSGNLLVGTGLTIGSETSTTYNGSVYTINHSNSVTAGTAKGDDSKTLTFGGTFTIPSITYDAQGHITSKGTTTMTMPTNPNTDAKVKQSTTNVASYKPIVLGYTETTTVSDLDATVTNQVYVTTKLYAQPSSGTLYMDGKCFIGTSTQSSYPTGGIHVHDVRNVTVTPDMAAGKSANFYFHQYTLDGTNNYWWGVLNVRPWDGGYSSWEIAGPAHSVDQRTTPLYVRTSNKNTAWGNWRKIYDTANKPTAADVGAVPNTKAGMNAAIDLLDTGADSVEMTDSTTFISHDISASTVAYYKRSNLVMYNYIYKKLQHNNAMDVSHTFAAWNTVGWHRCFSMPCSSTPSGRIIRTLEITVYRNYNNGQPEYFKVRLAGLYNATESFDVLYQKSNTAATQYITKIRMVKSADLKTLYIDLYYNSTNSNANTMYVKWYDPANSLTGSEKITWSTDTVAQAVQDDSLTVVATLDIPWKVGDGYSKGSSDHWGVMFPGGSTSGWLRTSSSGLLPNTSGGLTRGSGSYLGASAWAFLYGYIKSIHSVNLNVYNSTATYKHEITSITSANRTVTLPDTNCTVGTGLFYVIGTQTAATGAWTGSIPISALYDGLTIAYYLPYPSVSTNPVTYVTLNLTLADGSKTGAKEVYWTGTSKMTTHFAAGSTIILTYWSAGSIKVSGTATTTDRWTRADYNTNSDTKVNVTLNTTSKAYLLATTTTPTSTAAAVTSIADTGVYLDTTAGTLTATSFRSNNNIKIYDADNPNRYTQIKYKSTIAGSISQYFPTVDGEIQVSQGQTLLYNGTVSLTSSTQLTISGDGELSDYRLLMMEFWSPGSGNSHHIVVPWQYVRSQSSGTYVWFQSLPAGQSSDATNTNHNNCMGILSDSGGSSYSSKIVLKPGGNFTGSWLIRVYALI